MNSACFADTNLFLYAASHDPADRAKKERARLLLETEDIGISAQVLQEFFAAATRKNRLGLTDPEAAEVVAAMREFPVQPITAELVIDAIALKAKHQLSYWDAAIVAAARELSCDILYTEDLNDGQDYSGVIARNPFAG